MNSPATLWTSLVSRRANLPGWKHVALLLLAAFLLSYGCLKAHTAYPERWEGLRLGFTLPHVRKILGYPDVNGSGMHPDLWYKEATIGRWELELCFSGSPDMPYDQRLEVVTRKTIRFTFENLPCLHIKVLEEWLRVFDGTALPKMAGAKKSPECCDEE